MDPYPATRYTARDLFDDQPRTWKACLYQHLCVNAGVSQDRPALFGEIINHLRQHSYQARLNLGADAKDDAKARASRIKGNQMYHPRVMKYTDALRHYNEAIAAARKGSPDRAIAYANRSIICLEQGMYRECLLNIRLARESNYPKRFDGILAVRETKAKEACQAMAAMKRSAKANKAGGTNKNNRNHHHAKDRKLVKYNALPPAVNKCNQDLEIESGSYQGGTGTTLDECRYTMCDLCRAERLHTLIPCEGCTMVMYCSEDCLIKAWIQYHRYECNIIRSLWNVAGEYAITVWRTIAKSISSFPNLQSMKEYLEMTLQLNQICDIAATSLAITPNHTDVDPGLPFRTFLAAILHRIVLAGTKLGPFCVYDPAMNRLLCDLILHYLNVFYEAETI